MERFTRIAKKAGYLLLAWFTFFVVASMLNRIAPDASPVKAFIFIGFVALLVATPIALFKRTKRNTATFSGSFISAVEKEHRTKLREVRKVWETQTRVCGLARELGTDQAGKTLYEHPQVMSVQSVPRGVEMLVRPVAGQSVENLMEALPRLENSLAVSMEGERVNGFTAKILLVLADPLTGVRAAGTTTPDEWSF